MTMIYWTLLIRKAIPPQRWLLLVFTLIFAFILAACGPASSGQMAMNEGKGRGVDHSETAHGDMFLENVSEVIMVNITAAPEGKDGEYLTVAVMDMEGNPVTDAMVSLEGNMNHAGMIPVFTDPVADDADGEVDGVYQVPFGFTMLGDWIIIVSAEMVDGSIELQDVNLSVSEETVEVHNMGMEVGKIAHDDHSMGDDHAKHDEAKDEEDDHNEGEGHGHDGHKDDDSEGHGHEHGDGDGTKMMASEEVNGGD